MRIAKPALQLIISTVFAAALPLSAASRTNEYNAGAVAQNMDAAESFAFISGIVEGLAHARYLRDDRDPRGRACIYRWFFEEDGSAETVLAAFERFPEHLPGAVVAALITRRCG